MPMYDDLLAASIGRLSWALYRGGARLGVSSSRRCAIVSSQLLMMRIRSGRVWRRYRAYFPSMPERVSQDLALGDMRIALSRDDLGPPPVSVTRARVRTAGRREIRRGKAAMVNDAQAFLDQVSSEAAAERYAGQARRWYGIADPKPRNTIK